MQADNKNKGGSMTDHLMSITGGAQINAHNPDRDRFMPCCAETSLRDDLNANTIIIDNNPIAIATQYPFPHQVEMQLRLLFDNQTPVLVVLASSSDIQNNLLPVYFTGTATVGELQTSSKFMDYIELSDTTEVKVFRLTITEGERSINVPVLHVHNWPDHRTIRSETTVKLVDLIETTAAKAIAARQDEAGAQNASGALPVIHCKAGVGRTGQTIAAMALKKYPELSLETIVRDLRASRNDKMIQTKQQMKTLTGMANVAINKQNQSDEGKSTFSFRKLFGKKRG